MPDAQVVDGLGLGRRLAAALSLTDGERSNPQQQQTQPQALG